MRAAPSLAAAAACLAFSASAFAQSQFFLFPVAVLEGVSGDKPNPTLQKSVVAALKDEATRPDVAIIRRFQEAVARAFPQSTVHASQVANAGTGGTFEFIPDGQCNARFRVPVSASYAMVLSVTRASVYRSNRAGLVDYQIPVTLTLQIIKPEKGKVAYTLSDTLYSPFTFSAQEAALPATRALINQKVVENVMSQVDHLVGEAAKVFNPKASVVKIVGRSGKFLVLDGGFEIGFQKGESVEAKRVDKPGPDLFMKVVAANSGHSIVRLEHGDSALESRLMRDLEDGASLQFVFESAADDSAKPGLLPVTRFEEFGEVADDQRVVAEQFVKDLGFSSRFNIVPVNTNFKTTMGWVQAQANCVDWTKFPASSPTKESRTDLPHFFAQFDIAKSEIYRNEGSRNAQGVSTESEEDFAVATSVRLVDSKMRVHFSEVVVEPYKIKRVNNRGLSTRSGMDVAVKNSVLKLAGNFAKNARLEVRDLTVSRAEGNRLWVPASGLNPADVAAFTVFRELDVSFRGQKVWMPLELGEGAEPKAALDGGEIVLNFSRISNDTPAPRRGDRVRFEGIAKPGATNVQRCATADYFSDRSAYQPPFINMFVEAAVNASPTLQVVEVGDAFYDTTAKMLDIGNFKWSGVLKKPAAPTLCYQAGAALRPDNVACEGGRCKATVVNGLILRLGDVGGAAPARQIQAAQRTEASNIAEPQLREFVAVQSMAWFDALMAEFRKRVSAAAVK